MSINDEKLGSFPEELFESLLGGEYDFYGVDNTCFCIGVDGVRMALEATEDPDDGYRSYFRSFQVSSVGKIFFGTPIARVRLIKGGESRYLYKPATKEARMGKFSGWVLQDVESGHTWLTVGTDHGDDYYPCFTFDYTPDPSKTVDV